MLARWPWTVRSLIPRAWAISRLVQPLAAARTPRVVMMLAAPDLRTVPVTIHEALADVPCLLTADLLTETLRITRAGLIRDFGIARPRIAVAGLNPHAGEGGAMGREEIDLIIPTLDHLRTEGFDLAGPLPADTMFHPAALAGMTGWRGCVAGAVMGGRSGRWPCRGP